MDREMRKGIEYAKHRKLLEQKYGKDADSEADADSDSEADSEADAATHRAPVLRTPPPFTTVYGLPDRFAIAKSRLQVPQTPLWRIPISTHWLLPHQVLPNGLDGLVEDLDDSYARIEALRLRDQDARAERQAARAARVQDSLERRRRRAQGSDVHTDSEPEDVYSDEEFEAAATCLPRMINNPDPVYDKIRLDRVLKKIKKRKRVGVTSSNRSSMHHEQVRAAAGDRAGDSDTSSEDERPTQRSRPCAAGNAAGSGRRCGYCRQLGHTQPSCQRRRQDLGEWIRPSDHARPSNERGARGRGRGRGRGTSTRPSQRSQAASAEQARHAEEAGAIGMTAEERAELDRACEDDEDSEDHFYDTWEDPL